jgi:hypothetical protein
MGFSLTAFLMALLLGIFPAMAETGKLGKWQVYNAKDVDLSQITEADGRLNGTVQTFRPKVDPRVLYIDCPVPEDFTPEQLSNITVEYKNFDKKTLAAALLAVGTDSSKGKLSVSNQSWNQRSALYLAEDLIYTVGMGFGADVLALKTLNTSHEKYSEMSLAAHQSAVFLAELGLAPYEQGMIVKRLYDPVAYGLFPQRSDWKELQEENKREYARQTKKYKRTNFDYTVVKAGFMLRGLPVSPSFHWPEGTKKEPDATVGDVSIAELAIKDNGTVVEVRLQNLPVEISASPLSAPAFSWQDALREYIATYFVPHTNPKDAIKTDTIKEREYTEYASYSVLTEIKPIYFSEEKSTYKPAWCFVIEEKLVKDDTTVNVSAEYLDAVTLTNLSMMAFK